jgi:hypothetical protein
MTIPEIRKLVKQRKIIPFIGAGFSIPLGLPSWESLIRNLAAYLNWDPDVFLQSGNNNYLQLAEYFTLNKSIGELGFELSKSMVLDSKKLKASVAHRYLTKIQPKSIYTTNYDQGIEEAFKIYRKPYTVVRNINEFHEVSDLNTTIYKFHGDFIDASSLVLTETSFYERMQFEDPLDIRLRSDILNNTILLLGYSLNDINTRYIFYKLYKINKDLRHRKKPYSAIMVTFGISDIQRSILENWNIQVIELDPIDKSKSIINFLRQIK